MATPTFINNQNGNVLVILLIAIILFAALSFAVSGMMRGNTTSIKAENESIVAAEILNYARSVREAVSFLRITNQCEDTEISFERSPFDGSDAFLVNAGAPADFSCHVFHPNGGGITPIVPAPEVSLQDYIYTGGFAVTDLGTSTTPNLSMVLPNISLSLCEILNKRLGLGAPQQDDFFSMAFTNFTGTYALVDGVGSLGGGNAMYDAKQAGCFFEDNASPGWYAFYQTLIVR